MPETTKGRKLINSLSDQLSLMEMFALHAAMKIAAAKWRKKDTEEHGNKIEQIIKEWMDVIETDEVIEPM